MIIVIILHHFLCPDPVRKLSKKALQDRSRVPRQRKSAAETFSTGVAADALRAADKTTQRNKYYVLHHFLCLPLLTLRARSFVYARAMKHTPLLPCDQAFAHTLEVASEHGCTRANVHARVVRLGRDRPAEAVGWAELCRLNDVNDDNSHDNVSNSNSQ